MEKWTLNYLCSQSIGKKKQPFEWNSNKEEKAVAVIIMK